MFPKSLKSYVERALGQCKDEKQIAACQEVMKEVRVLFLVNLGKLLLNYLQN